MSSNKLFQNDMGQNDLSKIKSILFSILSPEQIEKMACVEITESAYHDSNGEPEFNGLFDTRMGVIERGKRCKSCEKDYITCPGHEGFIRLNKPVFNVQFADIIIKIAKCFCIRCAKLLVNKEHPIIKNIVNETEDKYHERFNKIYKTIYPNSSSKVNRCGTLQGEPGSLFDIGGCGAIQPNKYINNLHYGTNVDVSSVLPQLTLQWIDKGDIKTQGMNADMVLALFKRITEDEAKIMGFSKEWCLPHWLIIKNVLVTPPASRPSVRQFNGQRSEDDITNKYSDIIKFNNDLREVLKQGVEKYINPVICLLQYHINTLINNNDKDYTTSNTRSGRPIKSLMERLKGKEGRIRGNLMGKRVDYSARSVISPDANLKITDLGVPKLIAMNLTIPEIVNKYNYTKLLKIVRNGSSNYVGAKSIEYMETGKLISVTDVNASSIELNMGDVVNRHLMDDDYVLFNRQPSLHRMSMMAHRVKVMPGKTFRLNTDVCNPYNADFDGDEMNMHVPQSIQTQMELKYLAAVQHHFISPSSNSPIITPSQDNLLGVYKITSDEIELTQTEATHLLSGTEAFNGILPEPEIINGKRIRWTGKQIYSLILPPITLHHDDKGNNFIVNNGIVISGQVNKSVSSMIMQSIHSEYGSTETARYINDLQNIISRFLIKTGFSVGVSDMLLHPDIQKQNHKRIIQAFEEEVELMRKMHLNIINDKGTGDFASVFEGEAKKITTNTDKDVMSNTFKLLNSKNNRIKFMVTSGAKGKDLNIKQMMCLLGQQSIEGTRVPIGFTDRTLPHYPRYENGLESRGFITGNFIEGLNPQEFFFHAIAGRIGLIDTAVKTAKSGYLQRKLVKMMEDLKAYHDSSIRDGNNNIIEFCYGADGFDGMKLENQKTKFKLIKKDDLINYYIISKKDGEDIKDYVLSNVVLSMKKDKNWFEKCQNYNKGVQKCLDLLHVDLVKLNNNEVIENLKYPANIPKLIAKAKNIYGIKDCKVKSNIHFIDVINRIELCLDDCSINGERNNILMILLYDYLSPKKVLRDYNFNLEALEYVCAQIFLGFQKGLVNPGEMVGPVGAQSIGEQSTQMTLNTFHTAGTGATVTAGVPRMEEILSVTQTPKNPSNVLYLHQDAMFNKDKAEVIKNSISQIRIGQILKNDPEFYLEPTNKIENVLEEDKTFMKFYEVFTEMEDGVKDIDNNPWVIRLEFDRKEIINHNISMSDIHLIMQNKYLDSILMYSDDNSGKLVFRIKMPFESKQEVEDDIKLLKNKVEEIKNVIVKGVDNINKAFLNNVDTSDDKNDYYYIQGKKNNGMSKPTDIYVSKKEFVITTEGSNLFELLIRHDIDENKSYSIEPNEMWSIFGIEACKFIIQQQFFKVFADSGAFTNPRHISLLVNKMCHDGEPHSINIYGVAKENIGPLAKASFERPIDFFKNASLFGEIDKLKGVSANIMMGQIPNAGTGSVKCYLDEEAMAEGLKLKGLTKSSINNNITEKELLKQFEERICISEEDKIKINMTDVKEDKINLDMIPTIQVE